jgi:5-methylcytosine-specific restriction endonuclease McrA
MNSFNLAWFRPIELNELSQYFGLSPEECKEPYLKWSNEYKRLTKKLYYHQYEHRFRSNHNTSSHDDAYDTDEVRDNIFWKNWKDFEQILEANISCMNTLNNKHYSSAQHISSTLTSALECEYDRLPKALILENIKSLWFNLNIVCPSTAELYWLKSLDYKSGYLHTPHWAKVRAAILLISDAKCKFCSDGDWDRFRLHCAGDTTRRLHVHHLHYKNLGHERYEDLVLLCEGHHSIEHSRKASD